MNIQSKYHILEKTSIDLRRSANRIDYFINQARKGITNDTQETIQTAERILQLLNEARSVIPKEYRDVDLRKDES